VTPLTWKARTRIQGHQAGPEAQQRCCFPSCRDRTENSAERESLLANLQEGQEVKGIVKNLTDYGAFVDLGGVDGLLHITDMAWKRVKHPSPKSSTLATRSRQGSEVRPRAQPRIPGSEAAGRRSLASLIAKRYPEPPVCLASVTNLTDYGCFVEIEEGVEGLVHVSEMDWTNKNIHPSKVVSRRRGRRDGSGHRRRASSYLLGIKQCKPTRGSCLPKLYKGDRVSGKIKSITDFGIFIGLEGGIDGLVHLSDISWNNQGEEAVRQFKKGELLSDRSRCRLQVDPERERISLGIKQLGWP
jgi:small subunit ribosomal protein S1